VIEHKTSPRGLYRVELYSSWEREGEQNITYLQERMPKKVFLAAEEEFKRVNRRSDVQASARVYAIIGKTEYLLPEIYWSKRTK
jgi:hypothetical protein